MKEVSRVVPLSIRLPLLLISASVITAHAGPEQSAEAVRKADAVWSWAASTGNVDAWMAFYANDAIVLLPNEPLVRGTEHVRPLVSRLLQRPHLAVAWHALRSETAESADLVYVIAAYELHFEEARGRAIADHGRRTELWRLQSDGTWRCIVDTWSSDEQIVPAGAAGAAAASPARAPAPEPSVQGPNAGKAVQTTRYGDKPVHYDETVRGYLREHVPDASSVQNIAPPVEGYVTAITGTVLMSETRTYGWIVRATVQVSDAKTSHAGSRTYTFLFRGEDIVTTRSGVLTP